MATTHKITYAVSATPKVTVDAVAGASMETNSIHEDIRRTGGSTNYLQATSGGVNIGDGDTRFIWVKHTGYLWSSSSALGSSTTDKVNIYIDSEHIATLAAGEAWVIPLPDTSSTATNFKALRGSSSDIAVEAIGLD